MICPVIVQYHNCHLFDKFQSAYRENCSSEAALVRVHNDILWSIDCWKEVILMLLDMSAAFHTTHHSILLRRLNVRFGIEGTVVKWFESYLHVRSQRVVISGST